MNQQLEIVKKIPKEWKSKDGWRIMPLFPLQDGIYHIVKQGRETLITYETNGSNQIWSMVLYQELIDTLNNNGTILVDETVLKLGN